MRAIIAMLTLACLQACGGAFGGTKSFTLDVAEPAEAPPRYVVRLATLEVPKGANELDSIGTYHVGKLDAGELADIRKSLESTLQRVEWPAAGAAAGEFGLHILFTRYYVAHSNNDGAIIATVDWALASEAREIAFSERFFASAQASDVKGVNTLGKLKDLLNQQIVRRVVDSSVQVATRPEAKPDVSVGHTYATAQAAAEPLPKRLTSLFGLPEFSTKGVDWAEGASTPAIDWSRRLAEMN
jgi:hypothetical protein